jgi:hypothetical protein
MLDFGCLIAGVFWMYFHILNGFCPFQHRRGICIMISHLPPLSRGIFPKHINLSPFPIASLNPTNSFYFIILHYVTSSLDKSENRKSSHDWLGIRIMCPSGVTCLPADCCFSEI